MVSIIVPIYNKEKELNKCILSLINQSYKNLEIILINDGSKDSSKCICEKFKNQDSRVKLIDKENAGVELARISGIQIATGEYITFVDSDDWLPYDAIEKLVQTMKKKDADVVFGNFSRVLDKYGILKKYSHKQIYDNKIINREEFIYKYFDSFCGWGEMPVNMCGKLYKKSLIKDSIIDTVGISHGEDLCFNLQVLPNANKIVSIPDSIYFYRWGGMTNNINKNLFKDACKAYNFKLKIFEKFNCKDCYEKASVELCNFFKGYIDTYLVFSNFNELQLLNFIENEMKNKDLQKAVNMPQYEWFLNDEIYRSIKSQDAKKFVELQKKGIIKRKIKINTLKVINKVLT